MGAALRRLIQCAAFTAAAAAAFTMFPAPAWADTASETAATQAALGTLPLLASLGIGIAVAVGAVIAFLQLTSKDREPKETASEWLEAEAGNHSHPDDLSGPEAETFVSAEDEDEDEGHELTDYTIPFARIPVEPASPDSVLDGKPRLCGVGGEFSGASFRLNGRGLSIGRDPAQCHIVFPMDIGEVSRRHCSLEFEEERRLFLLEDHGSSNGTFFSDGERLRPGIRYELHSGQRFALSGGIHWFEVRE